MLTPYQARNAPSGAFGENPTRDDRRAFNYSYTRHIYRLTDEGVTRRQKALYVELMGREPPNFNGETARQFLFRPRSNDGKALLAEIMGR